MIYFTHIHLFVEICCNKGESMEQDLSRMYFVSVDMQVCRIISSPIEANSMCENIKENKVDNKHQKENAPNTLAEGLVNGASAFLSRICLPAAEEFGFLLKDRVAFWRTKNMITISQKAEKILQETGNIESHTNPRLVFTALENGSWAMEDNIQSMWAGLLASSCTKDGIDDGNLLFMNILSQLTTSEAKIIDHICKSANKTVERDGFLIANLNTLTTSELIDISGTDDVHRLYRELKHLTTIGLIEEVDGAFSTPVTEFDYESYKAWVTPTQLALYFYVRCKGSLKSPLNYFYAEN